ncbi:RagB/SusD family nutrient uptake outer membrane protein [Rubrolithibacter danxiaensis]|uniref:RagB/SusD family nutrient uptake outer membrane protein n=1 Tax=Rubrolithibacter danxiaensis TaxID=3390805 RepID=UPI003BF8CC7E
MKYKRYIYTSLICGALFSSCAKLEEVPYGESSTANFYKTEADANAAIVYAYAILPEVGYYSRGYYVITEEPTENLTQKSDAGADQFEFDELRSTANNSFLNVIWSYMYVAVTRANSVISYVPNVTMAEAGKNQIVGEGYFLRALNYFNLVRLFGEVPLRLEPITSSDQLPAAKASLNDIYNLIISDLQKAEELMGTDKREGRANKVAAQALLSKVYLFLASAKSSGSPGYDFVSNSDEMYANAKTYAGKVINGQSVYGFTDNLLDIWDISKYKNAGNVTEHIFDAAVDRSGEQEGNFSKLPLMFIPYVGSGFDMTLPDGTICKAGWNHFQTEPGIYNSYASNDKRKTDLIVSSVKDPEGNVYNLKITDFSRPFTRKYIDPNRVGDANSTNSPVIRYSDILLVYAEASGPTPEGYAAINKIRNRAGIGDLAPNLSAQAFRDAVIQERSWELAFEGDRLFDLRRTNSMDKVLVQKYGKTITSGAYFFPIPQQEIDTNPLINQ